MYELLVAKHERTIDRSESGGEYADSNIWRRTNEVCFRAIGWWNCTTLGVTKLRHTGFISRTEVKNLPVMPWPVGCGCDEVRRLR